MMRLYSKMRWLIFMALLGVLEALHCNKEFNYYDNYGNGFDITCQGLTREHIHLLANITITNEISLTIENATLTNISSAIFQNVHDLRFLRLENSTITFSKMKPIFDVLRLNRLKELILNNNKLEEFEPGSFQNVPNLSYLEVTRNRIHDMKTLPLCELQNLKGLNLSRNLITDLNQTHFYCRESDKTVDFNLNDDNYILDYIRHFLQTFDS
ncbi:hypothetical protein NQ315_014487 [Exocentrus adspersus]|uniref:Uncharacterized protein n=1 Tax=Exocentrus adspersus TaxID=1586481 RepID=A0AAV8VG37_9CUCU|nr:hypothetical protein NQ315_014487 [Exocentrus adspersus]